MEQSEKIQSYITEWQRMNPFVRKSIIKNVLGSGGRHAHVTIRNYTEMIFMSCSATSVRGPHTKKLFIDETCSGEERGNVKQIKASFGEVSTSSDIGVVLTSTAHFLFGFFVEVLNNPEKHGFKVYRWSIAKHESGETDPYLIYRYKTGWSPNVPWVTQEGIDFLRKNYSDEEWLVEALGGVATVSGSVYNPEDLEVAICDKCDVCKPYQFPHCSLVTEEEFKRVGERRLGIDWGDVAPNAFTVVGRLKDEVYVLFNDELVGVRDLEALDYAQKLCKDWSVEIVLADPAQYPMNNMLADRGITIHRLFTKGGQQKQSYVANTKRHFEHQIIHIPKAYEKLINSIKQLSYDKKGRIRKINDHSQDSLMHALSEYYEDVSRLYDIPSSKRFVSLWKL